MVVNVSKKDLDLQIVEQIDAIITEYDGVISSNQDQFGLDISVYYYFVSRSESIVSSLPKRNNSYQVNLDQAKNLINSHGPKGDAERVHNRRRLDAISNILKALKEDILKGYLKSIGEIIHADMFADFTEMAEHLLEEGYKDPAAVILGSVLEEHVRKLCIKNSVPLDFTDPKGSTKVKKFDVLNADLKKAGIYGTLDQQTLTTWYALRNKAAHGHYTEYDKNRVEIMLQSVRDFITRHPA
jgi:hypothetical protein